MWKVGSRDQLTPVAAMAGSVADAGPSDAVPADRAARATPSQGRRRVMGAGLGLFLLTFTVYWTLGTGETPYDFQLSQANNLIHGHLDMTGEYTRNLNVLERVLYDGVGFCRPVNDPRGTVAAADLPNTPITANCKTYMQHSLGPAFLLVPLVLILGMSVNQTLISVLVAALTSLVVFGIARRFSDSLRTQIAMTVLALFGTVLWEVGSNGGVWGFAHTTAVFFLYAAIYATVTRRSPLICGALVGAAFLCRPTTILAGFFLLVAFSDQWLDTGPGLAIWRRVRIRPLVKLAAGVAPFLLVAMTVNALRFGSPFESGYNYTEQLYQTSLKWRWPHGWFDLSYIQRHIAVAWEAMPIFSTNGSYVWPSRYGMAMWATTPPLFFGLFLHLRRRRPVALVLGVAVVAACAVLLLRAIWQGLDWGTFAGFIPQGAPVAAFWLLTGVALVAAVRARNRLVLACWAAIIPIAFVDWLFAATGWAQFGYRYGLDFLPFLFLLVVIAVGRRTHWYHLALIGLAVLVNLWGVLWINKFDPMHLWNWTWTSF